MSATGEPGTDGAGAARLAADNTATSRDEVRRPRELARREADLPEDGHAGSLPGGHVRDGRSWSGATPGGATPIGIRQRGHPSGGGAGVGGAGPEHAEPEHRPRRGRRRGRGEQLMVPDAEFRSYYDQAILKPPVWKVPDVPGYLYLGGLIGVSAATAALADLVGLPGLRRVGRLTAAVGAVTSVGALIHDLGRPTRFLHMLRVFKPTSPLSVGSWLLAPFGALSAAAAASEITGIAPGLGRAAGIGSAVIGPALATYTAVLISDTAVPAWHEAHRELPFVFAGSALASGGGVALLAQDGRAAGRVLAVGGAVLELGATQVLERRIGFAAQAYSGGRPGRLMQAARAATVAGALGAVASRWVGRRWLPAVSGLLLNVASATLRFGVFDAGMVSARDPAYTVVPQRERLRARQAPTG